jgi:hypothetical protein
MHKILQTVPDIHSSKRKRKQKLSAMEQDAREVQRDVDDFALILWIDAELARVNATRI